MPAPENNVNYITVCLIPPNTIFNRAYKTTTKQLEYEGHAVKGTQDSEAKWTIRKFVYNSDNQIQTERIAHNVSWDDRATTVNYD